MGGGQVSEEIEDGGPDANEEENDEDGDAPGRDMLRGPEIQPIAAVGGGEKVILDHNDNEEPLWRVLVQL